jgi:integrase
MEEYSRVLGLRAPEPAKLSAASPGALAEVIDKYREVSKDWEKAKPSTRRIYERHFLHLRENYGAAAFHTITERDVRAIRNELADRPSVADAIVNMIGRLWRFAKERLDMNLGVDPTREVSGIHTERKHHKAWPEEPGRTLRSDRAPRQPGSRAGLLPAQVHRAAPVGRGGHEGEAVRRSAVELYQVKTGTYVWVPAHKRLREHLAGVTGEFMLESNRKSRYADQSLSRLIREACEGVGYPTYSPHGLRHLAGASLAEAGCSVHEIMSILGHLTEQQAYEYVKQANRKVMAANAMAKWNAERTASD